MLAIRRIEPVLAGYAIRDQILAVLIIECRKIEPAGVTGQGRYPGCVRIQTGPGEGDLVA